MYHSVLQLRIEKWIVFLYKMPSVLFIMPMSSI